MEVRIYSDRQAIQPLIVWLEALKDLRAKAQIQARMVRVAAGNFGDCKPLRDGVQELRIDHGPGYRVYLSRQGPILILLLCGGDKKTQNKDIEKAIELLEKAQAQGSAYA